MFETWYRMADMLQSGLDVTPIITHRHSVGDFREAFELIESAQCGKGPPELGEPLCAMSSELLRTRSSATCARWTRFLVPLTMRNWNTTTIVKVLDKGATQRQWRTDIGDSRVPRSCSATTLQTAAVLSH
jgi:hypothetical protein